MGDGCLKAIAATFQDTFRRPADAVARFGGEEFMALLPNTPAKFALRLAETLRCKIEGLGITAANQTIFC